MTKRIGMALTGIVVALIAVLVVGSSAMAQGPGGGCMPGQCSPGGGGGGFLGQQLDGDGPPYSAVRILAEETDLTVVEIIEELRTGKSIADVASEHGVALNTIVDQMVDARAERLQDLIDDGYLTQQEADTVLNTMRSRITERLQEPWETKSPVAIVANTLGITSEELITSVRDGKTVAEIAAEQGVDLDTVVDALAEPMVERLQDRVDGGLMTQEEADSMEIVMRARIEQRLDQPWQQRMPRPDGFPRNRMMPGNPGNNGNSVTPGNNGNNGNNSDSAFAPFAP